MVTIAGTRNSLWKFSLITFDLILIFLFSRYSQKYVRYAFRICKLSFHSDDDVKLVLDILGHRSFSIWMTS